MYKNAKTNSTDREKALTRELSPLIAKLYELDPDRASPDSLAIIETLRAAD
jgi:hypothetical protein